MPGSGTSKCMDNGTAGDGDDDNVMPVERDICAARRIVGAPEEGLIR